MPVTFFLFALVALSTVPPLAMPAQAAEPSRSIETYALFAYDEMVLKGATGAADRGEVHGGNIGVNFAGRSQAGFALSYGTSGRMIMERGTQAVADSVRSDSPLAVFDDLFANAFNASFAATILGLGPMPFTPPIIAEADLPVLPFRPGRALTDGASDVTVGGIGVPSPFTFTPGAYRDVRINQDAVVTFGDGVFDLRSLSIGTNVTVNVTDRTVLQIDRDWSVNDGLRLGLGTNSGARIYIGADGFNPNALPVCNFAHGAEIHAQFFSPLGWLDLGGRNQLFGRYWARRISGDPNNIVRYENPEIPPDEFGPRRFQCYEIHRPKRNLKGVSLVDALGASTVTVERAKRICAPADVNGTDPTAPLDARHLTYYTIKQTGRFKAVKGVSVTTEFGTALVRLAAPDRMLVPTAKSLVSTPDALATPTDHYKCYRVAGTKFRASGLRVTDQFGTIRVDIKRPLHVCLPAAKNGDPVVDPALGLMCFLVKGTRAVSPPATIFTRDSFGPDQFPFFGPRDHCVPATFAIP